MCLNGLKWANMFPHATSLYRPPAANLAILGFGTKNSQYCLCKYLKISWTRRFIPWYWQLFQIKNTDFNQNSGKVQYYEEEDGEKE